MVRSGDEPVHARSPLRLRLSLAVIGAMAAAALGAGAWAAGSAVGAAAAGLVALAGLVNAVVVVMRLRAGPHFQPGRDVPAYRPAESPARPSANGELPESVRLRRYLVLMGSCLGLITLAWVWVRLVSVPTAIVMSIVAMVIPPIAVIVANAGWSGRRR
jgi:hypothetical protein